MLYFDTFLDYIFVPLYAVTLILSLSRYPKYYDTNLKYLPVLFIYTFLNELLGGVIRNYEEFSLISKEIYLDYNWLIYNLYMVIFYLYFYYIYYCYVEGRSEKTNIFYGGFLFLTTCLINVFLDDFTKIPQVYSYVVGGLVLIYCLVIYLKKFADLSDSFKFKENILFWISTGLLIFFMGYLPIKIIRYINTMDGLTPHPLVKRIHLSLIIISYTCFIIGFLRMKKHLSK